MPELNKRHILDEEDRVTMDYLKSSISVAVRVLKNKGIRHANIEIELMQHLKRVLNEE